jgi:hypothetical protein
MHRSSALALLVFSLLLQPLCGQNPDDLKFELRLVGLESENSTGIASPE